MILQVEKIIHYSEPVGGTGYFDDYTKIIWKDATEFDVIELKL